MNLIEKYIEIDLGPVQRKVTIAAGSGVVFVAVIWPVVHVTAAASGKVDVAMYDLQYLVALCALGLSTVVSLVSRESAGAFSVYFFITTYSTAVVFNSYLVGLWSTPYVAIYLIYVLFVAMSFGARPAIYTVCLTVVVLAVFATLQATGTLAYAPAVDARSLDAQDSGIWAATILAPVVGAFLITLVLNLLTIGARRLQEARLAEAHQRLERSNELIRRYVPRQLAEGILSGDERGESTHERRKLTIFFSDLVGFTDISDELEPEDLSRVLNDYFTEMMEIAGRHGGTVDELSGDAILVFFGAPAATNDRDHALRAARMALEMQRAIAPLNERWSAAGIDQTLQVRMGINTGVVTIGNFGSPDRMKYAALGKQVNLAARLQTHCEPGQVLLSHTTWLLVHEELACTPRGEVHLKGLHKPVQTYELGGA